MKIRQGFISNSSSSSFIIRKGADKQEIINFVKEQLIKKTEEMIKEAEKTHFPSNWEEYIEMLKEDVLPEHLAEQINVETVKEYQAYWGDLNEWNDLSEVVEDDLVLYDTEDNFLNWVTDIILEKYDVIDYCTHMG